jgi:hypothetical protein
MSKVFYSFILLFIFIVPAQAFKFDSFEKVPKTGVVEATFKGELYIISSAKHTIPGGGIGKADGEQIAFEVATLVAKSQLADYFKSDFDSSKIFDKAYKMLDGKTDLSIELKQKIMSSTKGVILQRVKTLTIVKSDDSVQVVVGISESDFLSKI